MPSGLALPKDKRNRGMHGRHESRAFWRLHQGIVPSQSGASYVEYRNVDSRFKRSSNYDLRFAVYNNACRAVAGIKF
jgi:hypothetical protein